MTSASTPLTAQEITLWAGGLAKQLERHLVGDARQRALEELGRDTDARPAFSALAGLALLADGLRVAHLAIDADGKVEDDELDRALPVAAAAAKKYFQQLSRYEAYGDPDLGAPDLKEFLRVHGADRGPFGNRSVDGWRGIRLCQEAARLSKNRGMLLDHERMLSRVMDVVFAGRASATENAARRQLRELFEESLDGAGEDPRAIAFCRSDGPEVFSSVAHGSQLFERDPFDIESIHAEAREVFHRQLEHAVTPARHQGGHGRTLLVLGQAGSGKTHLMRALRTHVHGERLGYVGYLQMTSEVGDYARYVLANLIDSLERPYDAPSLTESGLSYLSDGLADLLGPRANDQGTRLREDAFEPAELTRFVGGLVDTLVRSDRVGRIDGHVLQALLLLQRRDPALQRRVVKFLRCEALTSYEEGLLGGLAARTQPEDPARMLEQLGLLMFELQQAALVLLVDQVEDTLPDAGEPGDARGPAQLQRAIDVLRKVADAVPSSVIVISCLEDVYDGIRPRLTTSVVDRLEREPPPIRLAAERRRDEVQAMLTCRLEFLYDAVGATWRDDEPLYPFRDEHVATLANQRARECLAWFHRYQQECIRAQRIVDVLSSTTTVRPPPPPDGFAELDRAWNDAKTQQHSLPDEDEALLQLLARGIGACRFEIDLVVTTTLDLHGPRARLTVDGLGDGIQPRLLDVCNRQAQGGHLGRQLEELRSRAPQGYLPVAVRTSEFEFGSKTAIARQVGEFIRAGGMTLPIGTGDLRAVAALVALAERAGGSAEFTVWRRQRQPLTQLGLFRRLLELDRVAPTAVAKPTAEHSPEAAAKVAAPPVPSAPVARQPTGPIANRLRLGVTSSMRADPVVLEAEQFKTHAAFLGTTGSGKTTLALNVIEQLLERGISAVLVDRKGDLARYADPAWWETPSGDEHLDRRKAHLRSLIEVALYTPGDPAGRPLRLPVIPAGMAEMTGQERDQVAKVAAGALAGMMQYGRSETHTKKISILKKAIEMYADRGAATLDDLRDTIGRPDPELLAAVGSLTRHFGSLAEDLDSLALQRGMLLAGDGEALDVEAMLTPRDGRTRLALISTVALTDVAVLQFWVARLLIELGRLAKRRPSASLRAIAFFDEADAYVPAMSSPPTKEPMFELLRRARAGGLGVLLASQNPADFDYRARDLVNTWMIGRVSQDRAIDKMRNLLSSYPNVGSRLAGQSTGCFFLLGSGTTRELRADRSLMLTEQLAEHEISELARPRA